MIYLISFRKLCYERYNTDKCGFESAMCVFKGTNIIYSVFINLHYNQQ